MEFIESIVEALTGLVWNTPSSLPWLVVLLLFTGLFVTVRLGFIQLRRVGHALTVVSGKYDDEHDQGDINHFQALATALSATVGIGNIAGVAIAIHFGGPGAIFWMWVTALLGMALKYAECTMSMMYRDFDPRGQAAGGPMYYIEKGLGKKWRPMALVFAACTVIASFGGGNMNQSNTVAVSARTDFGANEVIVGLVLAVIVGAVILGGIRRIGQVSSKLAPGMAIIYVLGALAILLLHIEKVPDALADIVSYAFSPEASLGGSVAGTWMITVVWGIRRGLFSNEAGQGSAPIAHAAAKTDEPVREGAVAMLGPLIDTLIICTMTALVILVTGVWDEKHDLDLDAARTTMLPASLLPKSGHEYDRITAARAKLETHERREQNANTATDLSVDVLEGRQQVLAFVAYDGLVDAPILLGPDGQPFSGTLTYRAGSPRLLGPSEDGLTPIDIKVRGKMLYTSSALTAKAFERGLDLFGGGWGNYIVTFCVLLFAISTMISWSYYGDRAVVYLLGYRWVIVYRGVYVFFVFIGAWAGLKIVWTFGDLALGIMAVPNLIAVLALNGRVVRATKDYFKRMKVEEA